MSVTYITRILRCILFLLLAPHPQEQREIFIPCPLHFQRIQRVPQKAVYVHIPPVTEEVLHSRHELGVDVSRKGMAWIVDEDAHEHDRIVLHIAPGFGGIGQQLGDAKGGFAGGVGAGFGTLNDGRKVNEFVSILNMLL